MQILFTDRALLTIRHMDQIFFGGGGVSMSPYLDKKLQCLCIYFI